MNGKRVQLVAGVLILSLLVALPATPMGSAMTYQGRLLDANFVADDTYDFQFKLFDANTGGTQSGGDVNVPNVEVIDGYFMVELDFGSAAFSGDTRWLEIGVRPGDMNDPNIYTVLDPRQQVMVTP